MIPKSTLMTCLTVGALAFTGVGIASWLRSNVVAQTDAPTGKPAAGVPDDAIERTRRNLQKVLLAIHNYRDTFDIFPPAALYGSEGRPNLSWRVAILPYLNENDLYNEFIKDEPWDSPHNIKLLARMPAVFKTPISPAPEVETRMRGFQGKDAMFDGVVGLRITEVTDGTSNTAMIAVTRQAVPWTKPEEIPFAKGLSTDALLEAGDHGPMVGLADGQVRYAKKGNGVFLGSIITRSGNEAIDWPPKPGDPTNEPPKLVPIPTPTAATQYLPAPLMTVPDTTSSPQPQGGFMPGYGIGQPQLAGKGGMGIAIPDMSGMGRGRQAGGEGMGAAMGGSAATQVLDPLVERRLQSLEAKLDLILKRLEAKPEAQPTPPVRLRQ